jgi:hypothetical protein
MLLPTMRGSAPRTVKNQPVIAVTTPMLAEGRMTEKIERITPTTAMIKMNIPT